MNNLKIFLLLIISLFTFTLVAQKSLKIGSDEWSPFHYAGKSNEVEGFTVDLVKETLKTMEVSINDHKIYPWKRVLKMVFDGSLDAVFTTTKTAEREENCYFPSESLTDFSYVFFIRKEDKGKINFTSISDLSNQKIGIVNGFSYTKEFMEFIKNEKAVEAVDTGNLNIKKLLKKRVDIIVMPRRVGIKLLEELDTNKKILMLETPLDVSHLYMMFSKKTMKSEFAQRFSQALKEFKLTPQYREIKKKYNWK